MPNVSQTNRMAGVLTHLSPRPISDERPTTRLIDDTCITIDVKNERTRLYNTDQLEGAGYGSLDSVAAEDVFSLAASLPPPATAAGQHVAMRFRVLEHLRADIDPYRATIPLICYCFMTGYIDTVSFSACFSWCAFQTGNTILLGLAIARLFTGPEIDAAMRMQDKHALVSFLSFLAGGALGRFTNIENSSIFGAKKRAWLFLATLATALLTLAGSIFANASKPDVFTTDRGEAGWTDMFGFLALGCISASMGLQAIVATRLGSHFATSVVLTTIWVQIVSEPSIIKLNRRMLARDSWLLAVLFVLIGGIVGHALGNTIGDSSTLAMGAGIRVLIAILWLFAPAAVVNE
ncbi:hypothetical protein EXIGLDRAFT_756360 [Exidia glandulosa HHB12029]|uniref:DUF1275 domain protein n=1 Tax=Exidia glandulosa HHB12029 TaxID=1314781 RepID=A0A165BBI8_EXIGL|nr:hypothetical protein EXIGLDRAFT_756360 [Exidia glandulosa HHB12029]